MEPTYRSSLLQAFCALSLGFAAFSASAQQPAALNAREAGARYGQALGVALVCYGLKTRPTLWQACAATIRMRANAKTFRTKPIRC